MNLLPCPFCGETPHFTDTPRFYAVNCRTGRCGTNPGTGSWPEKEQAIKAWNTRPRSLGTIVEAATKKSISLTVQSLCQRDGQCQIGVNYMDFNGVAFYHAKHTIDAVLRLEADARWRRLMIN